MKFVRTGLLLAATLGFVQTAAAADMPVKAAGIAPAPWSWTGFYAGGHVGYAWGNDDPASFSFIANGVAIPPVTAGAASTGQNNGAIYGGHLGYNWQLNPNWVVGIEGDFTGTGIRGTGVGGVVIPFAAGIVSTGDSFAVRRDVNWLATVRGRIGYAWATNLIYFTGGAAWADVDLRGTFNHAAALGVFCFTLVTPGCSVTAVGDTTKSGWVLGGGYEAVLSGRWLWRVEYLYYSFDNTTASAAIPPATGLNVGCIVGVAGCTSTVNFGDLNIHSVRLGLSYKF